MADVRKSATHTAARKRAREKAASFREKQERLEALAADYFLATDEAIRIRNDGQEELDRIQARINAEVGEALLRSEKIICDMLDLAAPKSEVAERLGIANRHIRQAIAHHGGTTTPPRESEPAAADTAPDVAG